MAPNNPIIGVEVQNFADYTLTIRYYEDGEVETVVDPIDDGFWWDDPVLEEKFQAEMDDHYRDPFDDPEFVAEYEAAYEFYYQPGYGEGLS